MKKPRKSRPKARQRRAVKPAPAPRRVYAPPRQAIRLGDVLRIAERRLAAATASSTEFFERTVAEFSSLARTAAATELGPKLRRLRAEARTLALPYSRDEREALALLFLPFLMVASAIAVHQSARALQSYLTAIALPEHEIAPVRPRIAADVPFRAMPPSTAVPATPQGETLTALRVAPEPRAVAIPGLALEATPVADTARTVAAPDSLPTEAPDPTTLAPATSSTAAAPGTETKLALLAPADGMRHAAHPLSPAPIETFEADESGKPIRPGICAIDETPRTLAPPVVASWSAPAAGREDFGLRLAQAAESQVGGFVIYNDAYRSMSYPMGDVHSLFGVCTDVIVRAYRALGLDLQALVHQARSGTGDTNIDQRRTEVLRRFFAAHGESLPVTSFPEDYRPGDIVTYYRPQNRRTRAHIAIVSSVVAPSGRPMIVHNRGWGPQLEDALFVDAITGHYRYRGPAPTRNAAAQGVGVQAIREASGPAPVLPASFPAPVVPSTQRQY